MLAGSVAWWCYGGASAKALERGGEWDPVVGPVLLVAECLPGVCFVVVGVSVACDAQEGHVKFVLSNGVWANFLANFGVADTSTLQAGSEEFEGGNSVRPTCDIVEPKIKPQWAVHTGCSTGFGVVFLDGEAHVLPM
eukprot:3884428-Pleurochrysis_carterae.AAC.2